MIIASCPECQQQIELNSNPEVGQQVTCGSCKMDLEVTWLLPISLDYLEVKEKISAFGELKHE